MGIESKIHIPCVLFISFFTKNDPLLNEKYRQKIYTHDMIFYLNSFIIWHLVTHIGKCQTYLSWCQCYTGINKQFTKSMDR